MSQDTVQVRISAGGSMLRVSVERQDELELVARYLAGKQVVLFYKDKTGDYQEWAPVSEKAARWQSIGTAPKDGMTDKEIKTIWKLNNDKEHPSIWQERIAFARAIESAVLVRIEQTQL